MNGNEFNYVASGLSFCRFFYKGLEDPQWVELIGSWIKKVDGAHGHRFSVLFNAFTEKKMGPLIKETMKPYLYDVHADSGGLQIISRGMQVDAEKKKSIYEVQGKYADVAMSFDEIPVYTLIQKSELKDASNKVFDRSMLVPCAKKTAQNLIEQIEFFQSMGSDTRPLAIVQGNCLETAQIWSETMLQEIPQDMHKFIGGVAIGSPALGVGEFEEVKKAFWFPHLPFDIEKKHLHLLGVGSMRRILPTLIFARSGFFRDTFISYDSTTHTSMNTFGIYLLNSGEKLNFNRRFSQDYVLMFEDMVQTFPEVKEFVPNPERLHFLMNTTLKKLLEQEPKTPRAHFALVVIANALACIYNFTKYVQRCLEDQDVLLSVADDIYTFKHRKIATKHVDTTKRSVYNELSKVKTLEDFAAWEREFGRFLESKPARSNISTLEDFLV